jgi:2-polyprenyl-6-methoxyphenol hydroxylase-like FAD-dependent oxidoreductase
MIFFERRMVIDVLHKNIRQKEKVLTSRRVVDFEMDEHGVSAKCQDGSVHRGSILIGADGIRSTVARQMLRLSGSSKKGKCVLHTHPVALMILSMPRPVLFGAPCLLEVMNFVTSEPPNPYPSEMGSMLCRSLQSA